MDKKRSQKTKNKVHLEMRNLKQTELQRLKNRGKKGLGYDQKSLHGPLLFFIKLDRHMEVDVSRGGVYCKIGNRR